MNTTQEAPSYFESAVTAVASTITIENINPSKPHGQAGLEFYSDSGGTTPVIPTAGTVAIGVKTVNTPQVFEAVTGGTITASTPTTVNFSGSTIAVQAVPTGITGATHYRLTVTAHLT